VIPVWANDRSVVIGVLDVDSDIKAAFTAEDTEGLEAICRLLSDCSFDNASIPILE
jgi:putative methionine-R-sulfoxide reductase with GAF domain